MCFLCTRAYFYIVCFVDRPVSSRQPATTVISDQQQYPDDADSQLSISRRSPRRSAAVVAADDPSCRRSPPPPPPASQVPVTDRRPSPLHLDASRRSPRDHAAISPGRGARPPISPRDAAAIAAGADRRTTFATQKSFSYDVPRVEPPPQVLTDARTFRLDFSAFGKRENSHSCRKRSSLFL